MPTPTFANLASTLQAFTHMWEEGREFAEADATNFVGLLDTFQRGLVTDFQDLHAAAGIQLRGSLDSYLRSGNFFEPWLRDYARFLDVPVDDLSDVFDEIYQDFINNARRVQTRGFTLDTPSADPSNAGDGVIRRLTVDAQGFDIESTVAEQKFARCIQDAQSGTIRGEERFRFKGALQARDALETLGSGASLDIRSSHSRRSLLLNPGFDAGGGGSDTAPTSIANWSSDISVTSANFTFDTTNRFLPAPDDTTTVRSLRLRAAAILTQKLTARRMTLNPRAAYHTAVAFNSSAGLASGTLILRNGTQAVSVSVAGANTSGWRVLELSSDLNTWFENLNTNDQQVQIEWNSAAGAGILIDDVFFVPYQTDFDNTGYVVRPAEASFQTRHPAKSDGDEFNWTDTESGAVINRWLARRLNRFLPHSASPTLADP